MKKHLLIISFVALAASGASANTGIGISLDENSTSIFLPINLSETLRIEPHFQFYLDKNTYKSSGEDEYTRGKNTFGMGIGLFGIKSIEEGKFDVIYGSRLIYIKSKSRYRGELSSSDLKVNTYRLSPTVGMEYYFTNNFSLGGDFSLNYSHTDERDHESTEKSISTDSNITARFYF